MPSACAASRARPRSREAMAAISQLAACCIPGITFRVPILAVLRTPQRIFDDISAWLQARFLEGRGRQRPATTRAIRLRAQRSQGALRRDLDPALAEEGSPRLHEPGYTSQAEPT